MCTSNKLTGDVMLRSPHENRWSASSIHKLFSQHSSAYVMQGIWSGCGPLACPHGASSPRESGGCFQSLWSVLRNNGGAFLAGGWMGSQESFLEEEVLPCHSRAFNDSVKTSRSSHHPDPL